jgi:hypothetical protein
MLRHDLVDEVDEVMDVDLRLIAIGLREAVAALDEIVAIPIRRNCSPLGHVGMLRGRERARWRGLRSCWFSRFQTHRWADSLIEG